MLGYNGNVFTYKHMSLPLQKFKYDKDTKQILNESSGKAVSIETNRDLDNLTIGSNIISSLAN